MERELPASPYHLVPTSRGYPTCQVQLARRRLPRPRRSAPSGSASEPPAGGGRGAAIGTAVGGPIGTAIGGILGAIAGGVGGGYAGNEIAHAIDPEAEDSYWASSYTSRPYVGKNTSYTQYRPAYRYGVSAATKVEGKTFEEVESDLRKGWAHSHSKSRMAWENAKPAVRDAYDRVQRLHEERRNVHKGGLLDVPRQEEKLEGDGTTRVRTQE